VSSRLHTCKASTLLLESIFSFLFGSSRFELILGHVRQALRLTHSPPPVYFALIILEMGSPELFAGFKLQSS
jgi:hypothetical protein